MLVPGLCPSVYLCPLVLNESAAHKVYQSRAGKSVLYKHIRGHLKMPKQNSDDNWTAVQRTSSVFLEICLFAFLMKVRMGRSLNTLVCMLNMKLWPAACQLSFAERLGTEGKQLAMLRHLLKNKKMDGPERGTELLILRSARKQMRAFPKCQTVPLSWKHLPQPSQLLRRFTRPINMATNGSCGVPVNILTG